MTFTPPPADPEVVADMLQRFRAQAVWFRQGIGLSPEVAARSAWRLMWDDGFKLPNIPRKIFFQRRKIGVM